MKCLSLLLLILATSARAQMAPDQNVKAIFERFRGWLRTGNTAADFPVMAPWIIDQQDLVYRLGGIINLAGEIQRTRVDGLDGFITNSASFDIGTKRMAFSFTLNDVKASGWYDLEGSLFGLVPIFGFGNFFVAPKNFVYQGYANFETNGAGYLNIFDMSVSGRMQAFENNIEGLLFGGELGNLLNEVVRDFLPAVLKTFEKEISDDIRDRFLPYLNKFFNTVHLSEMSN